MRKLKASELARGQSRVEDLKIRAPGCAVRTMESMGKLTGLQVLLLSFNKSNSSLIFGKGVSHL